MCKNLHQCRFGTRCKFAHSKFELRNIISVQGTIEKNSKKNPDINSYKNPKKSIKSNGEWVEIKSKKSNKTNKNKIKINNKSSISKSRFNIVFLEDDNSDSDIETELSENNLVKKNEDTIKKNPKKKSWVEMMEDDGLL